MAKAQTKNQVPARIRAHLKQRDEERAELKRKCQANRQALAEAWMKAMQTVADAERWGAYAQEFHTIAEQNPEPLAMSGGWVDGWQRLAGGYDLANRFRKLAADAGKQLGARPLWRIAADFWQDCVFLHESDNCRRIFTDSQGGALKDAFRSSEALCWHLAAQAANANAAEITEVEPQRFTGTVDSPIAARRMEEYIKSKNISVNVFAGLSGTTDRTLRNFRKTGKIRHDIFESIAQQMGVSRDELLKVR